MKRIWIRCSLLAMGVLLVAATLASADGDVLTFERPLSAGVMSFKLQMHEIESLRATR